MSFRVLYVVVFFFSQGFHGIYASYLRSTNDKLTPVKGYTSERYSNLLSFILLYVDSHILFLLSACFVFPKKDGLANCALYFA